ncbi:MAG: hypothetical protein HYU84_02675 [Chloroflexi bacterium]|nr:hypothetical protein [Chloroflexota bacterium]MBI3167162.1 hypothetical protein [Chloroflexota bacterium]
MFKHFSTAYPRLAPFLTGFFGWFLFNTVVWIPIFILLETAFAPTPSSEGFNQLAIIPYCFIPGLLNIGIVILLLIKWRWAALGWILAGLFNLGMHSVLSHILLNEAAAQLFLLVSAFFGFPFYFLLILILLV